MWRNSRLGCGQGLKPIYQTICSVLSLLVGVPIHSKINDPGVNGGTDTSNLTLPNLPPEIICQIIKSAQSFAAFHGFPTLKSTRRFRWERHTLFKNFSRVSKTWRVLAKEEYSRWVWVTSLDDKSPISIIPNIKSIDAARAHFLVVHYIGKELERIEAIRKTLALFHNTCQTYRVDPDFPDQYLQLFTLLETMIGAKGMPY